MDVAVGDLGGVSVVVDVLQSLKDLVHGVGLVSVVVLLNPVLEVVLCDGWLQACKGALDSELVLLLVAVHVLEMLSRVK